MKRFKIKPRSVVLTASVLAVSGLTVVACIGQPFTVGGSGPGPVGPGSVTTYHNNSARDGNYPYETALTQSSVTADTFGKIASLPVDGQVYGQPLVAKSMQLPNSKGIAHDLLLVVTEHDTIYAFDAQSLSPTPIWRNNLIGDKDNVINGQAAPLKDGDVTGSCSGCSTLTTMDSNAPNITPEIGITATPVIDPASGIMYVVAASKENSVYHIRLHALDITTGVEVLNPVDISGALPGTGLGSFGGVLTFDVAMQLSRSGLALNNGVVYVAFSSFNDNPPAHGWIFGYDAATLSQMGQFVSTPNSDLGNIWMAGSAPAIDESTGAVYVATGNGDPNDYNGTDYDDSIIKLEFDKTSDLLPTGWFTPYNHQYLTDNDFDLGSGGIMLLPDLQVTLPNNSVTTKKLLVQAGKEGTIHVLDRTGNLGHNLPATATADTNIWQELPRVLAPETLNSFDTGVFVGPVYFNNRVYFAPSQSSLRAFSITNGQLSAAAVDEANEYIDWRGGGLAVSSNGANNGIIWMLDPSAYTYGWNAQTRIATTITNGPSVLYAYNPANLSKPLYRSDAELGQDNAGNAIKFAVPTVAGGHVYIGTQTEVTVYGLLPQPRNITPVTPGLAMPPNLSDTGLFVTGAGGAFSPTGAVTPASGLLPYDVITPLWSDGASKYRWINLPPGKQIGFDPTGGWTFPLSTQLIKEFDLNLGNGVTTRLETRVLTLTSTGWVGVTYQWTQAQTDAVLLSSAVTQNYTITAANGTTTTQQWYFPSPGDCLNCHNSVAGGALGVRTRQLNHAGTYPGGATNELAYWNSLNLFATNIGDPSQYTSYAAIGDTTQSLDTRVRSYLAVNCAECHVPNGPAGVGIDFSFDTPLASTGIVNVMPTKGNMGVTGALLLTPGNPGESVMYLRMNTTAPGRMPPLATSIIDTTAVQAVNAWITAIPTQ